MMGNIQAIEVQIPHEVVQYWGWFLVFGLGLLALGIAAVVRSVSATVATKVDKLCSALALRFAHRLQDTRLGDAAEIIGDRRPPACIHHVESNRASEPIGVGEALLDAPSRNAWTAVTIALFVKRVDAERHAMRQQHGAAGLVESSEPVPERGLVLRQIGFPGFVTRRDLDGGGAVLEVRWLGRKEYVPY